MKRSLLVFLSATMSTILCGTAAGQRLQVYQPRVLIVFDASRSMYETVGNSGKVRLDAAKEFVGNLLDHWKREIQLGLLVYGHRARVPSGKRCDDVEIIVPVGTVDLPKIRRTVAAIQARGTTPLCRALEMASEHLKIDEEPATLLLISDGIEACGGDITETIRRLVATSEDFQAHVISFDSSDENNRKLRQIASFTDGEFFVMKDQGQAKGALAAIMNGFERAANLIVTVVEKEGGEPVDEVIEWKIYGAEPDSALGRRELLRTVLAPGLLLQNTPGYYWVTAALGKKIYSLKLIVDEQGDARASELVLEDGKVRIEPPSSELTLDYRVTAELPDPPEDAVVLDQREGVRGAQTFALPQGYYNVAIFKEGALFRRVPVQVEAARELDYLVE